MGPDPEHLDEQVDEDIDESFPASDPPSHWGGEDPADRPDD
jgi:hypothetical protein